jgi:transposase
MEQWSEIRRRVLTGEISKREACSEYGIHWKTLEKMLRWEEPPGYRQSRPRPRRRLRAYLPYIHEILEADRQAPRKQRHTARRIFQRLREERGYRGCESIIRAIVHEWHKKQAEVFVPLSQTPGQAQVDFGEAEVVIAGERLKAPFFVMTLPYSDAFFCCVFPRECTETFQEGHVRAFEFFGGVPARISYDNSKIAVARVVGGRGRTATREFLRLSSHFLFAHHFCRVRRAHEKGHVECMVGFARRNFMVPVPQAPSWEALNRLLEERCRVDLSRQLRGQAACKQELLEQERKILRPAPAQRFEARRIETSQANSLSLVRFDGNDYSVPTAWAYHPITVVGGVDEVRLVCRDQVVACHRRHWGTGHTTFDPVHYLALLERKPGALDFARPLEEWQLPVGFGVLRRRMEAEWGTPGGTREYIKVLRLLERASLPELTSAVHRALEIGASTADAVRVLLEGRREAPVQLFCLDNRPHLGGFVLPPPDLGVYHALQQGGVA